MNKEAVSLVFIIFLLVTVGLPGESTEDEIRARQDMILENPFLSEEFKLPPEVQRRDALPSGESKELTIEAYNWGFRYAPVTFRRGDRVKITLRSAEGIHGLVFPHLGLDTPGLSLRVKKRSLNLWPATHPVSVSAAAFPVE